MIPKTTLSYKFLQSREKEIQCVEDRDIEVDIVIVPQTLPFDYIYICYVHTN